MDVEKKPINFRISEKDNEGSIIERIYLKSGTHVIYRTKTTIRIDLDDSFVDLEKYMENHRKIGIELARIYSWLPEELSWSEPINRQIARAIAVNVNGNYDDAKAMLLHAEERIIKLKTIQGKLLYTASSFGTTAVALLLLIIFKETGLNDYFLYSSIIFCGALGGVLSVAIGYSSLEIDIDANNSTNFLVGSSRILIAMSAAVFVYFAISSDVILSFIGKSSSNEGVLLACMISGFSERLVPNIMSSISAKASLEDPGSVA